MKNYVKLLIIGGVVVFVLAIISFTSIVRSFDQGRDVTAQAVKRFHDQFNAGKFGDIYAEAGSQFQEASGEEKLNSILQLVQGKLGQVVESEEASFTVNYGLGGKHLIVVYKTKFSEGEAVEKFTYQVKSNQVVLFGYNVNSDVLLGQ
jgi:hypothetical protein